MSPWWRRNGLALVAIAVLVPVGGFGIAQHERQAFATPAGENAVTADADGRVEIRGVTVGPATADVSTPAAAPTGTKVVTVRLPVDTGGEDMACTAPALREEQGLQRRWQQSATDLGIDLFDPAAPASCPSDAGRWFTLVTSYIVPADADGPFWVELSWSDSLPDFARVPVAP